MIRRVLVAIDGSEHAEAAKRYAFWLAQRFGDGTVIGFHVVDVVAIEGSFLHDISGSLGFEPYLDFSSKMREALHERGRNLLEAFLEDARKAGVRAESELAVGVVPNEICDRARLADAVVIGRRGLGEKFSTGLLGGTTESVTRKCPKPVLVCPQEFRACSRPVLAYDGSTRASAAMKLAAEACSTLGLALTVLTVQRDRTEGARLLDEARCYLAPYRVEVETVLVEESGAPEAIARVVEERGHDLLFIGAYGHSRIVEMVLGSTTEYVLRNVPCPVFLSR